MKCTSRVSILERLGLIVCCVICCGRINGGDEPDPVNPFGKRPEARDDARPGYVEMSDGIVVPGAVYLTRDTRLRIYDETLKRQRDVPLHAVRRIECKAGKEWLEKEWRFKEAANDEKVFTGRNYPVREYLHTITLNDGRKITGPLSAIVYVQLDADRKAARFLLHKRDKGSLDQPLKSLQYVHKIEIGEEALAEGKRRADQQVMEKAGTKKSE
jgi:hypothetical protein